MLHFRYCILELQSFHLVLTISHFVLRFLIYTFIMTKFSFTYLHIFIIGALKSFSNGGAGLVQSVEHATSWCQGCELEPHTEWRDYLKFFSSNVWIISDILFLWISCFLVVLDFFPGDWVIHCRDLIPLFSYKAYWFLSSS